MKPLIIDFKGVRYHLNEVDAGIEMSQKDAFWEGYLHFACYTSIEDNQTFREAVEVMLLNGFGGHTMGGLKLILLRSININRMLMPEDFEKHGEELKALVKIGYRTYRDWAKGDVSFADGVHFVNVTMESGS